MTNAEWIAKQLASDRTFGTNSIEFDWGWYRIECSAQNPEEGRLVKDALVSLAKEYLELRKRSEVGEDTALKAADPKGFVGSAPTASAHE